MTINNPSRVIVHTEPNPEDNAMIQALYSRSSSSVVDHIAKAQAAGSGKFMETYYRNYGHASIADCGFVTLYFEGVSMLAAKAIEDNPLFNGQECSTRYIDFSTQPFYNPVLDEEHYPDNVVAYSVSILDDFRAFYVKWMPALTESLKLRFPNTENVPQARWEKAVAARAFDVLRGWLPAGATTNVSWTTSLRKAHEHLVHLMHHPLTELNVLAAKAYAELYKLHPNSFDEQYGTLKLDLLETFAEQLIAIEGEDKGFEMSEPTRFYNIIDDSPATDWDIEWEPGQTITIQDTHETGYLVPTKTRHMSYPRHSPSAQAITRILSLVDYGAFRDIQRHRNGYCSNYVLTTNYGDDPWYLAQLPEEAQLEAKILDEKLAEFLDVMYLEVSEYDAQYFIPMKSRLPLLQQYTFEQMRYFAELRSGKTVHATVRPLAQACGKFLTDYGFQCDYDSDLDDWTTKRGDQDIISKGAVNG